jgi:DNA-binding transcriptional regulator/RsmH inhibitor MraZ
MQGCFILCLEEENNLPRIQLIPESYKNERPEPSTFAAVEHRLVKFGTRARVTLPRDWCEAVGINTPGDLIITGRGCLIEFWAVENFNTMLAWEIQCPEDDDECADT